METKLKILTLKGKEILPYINNLANLRIKIFKDYPYLYDGDIVYETEYLSIYANSIHAFMVLVLDNQKIVGASTAIPLQFETIEFQQPFIENDIKIEDVFYLGESVLLHNYRGRGIYPTLFKLREQAARNANCKITAFCAVDRKSDEPRKPISYKPLDDKWIRLGYTKRENLKTYFVWKESGETNPSPKQMTFWIKSL